MYIPTPSKAYYTYRRGHYCFILAYKVYQNHTKENKRRIRFHAFLIYVRLCGTRDHQ